MSRTTRADPRVSALVARELGARPRPVLAELLRLQLNPLTEREHAVIARVLQGQESKAIAAALVVAVATVKQHLTDIYTKLGVTNRGEAVYLLLLLGVLALDPADADAAVLALRARHEHADDRVERFAVAVERFERSG